MSSNNGSKAQVTGRQLAAPIEDVPEIIKEALNALHYDDIVVNDKFCTVSALHRDREQYGGDRWDYSYDIRINWKKQDDQTAIISIAVSERNYAFLNQECQDRCERIWTEIESYATHSNSVAQDAESSTTHGSAKWAPKAELNRLGYLEAPDSETDSAKFIAGLYTEQGQATQHLLTIPALDTHAHVLVCGPTGSGKSRGVFIPNLINRLEISAIVTEAVAGERVPPTLYSNTAGWREAAGHRVFHFNPADLTSTRINPLDAIRPDKNSSGSTGLDLFSSASYVGNLIMTNTKETSPGEDKIWGQSETHLLTSLLLYAVGLRKDPAGRSQKGDNANLAHIRSLLRLGPEALEERISESPIKLAAAEYTAFLRNTSRNFRLGVLSGLMARLNPWVNPQIATLTEVTDFDPAELKSELFTFYLSTLITRPQHKSVSVLAFNYLLETLLDNQFKYPTTLMLDEFTNYGYIPEIDKKLTMIRNQKIGMVIGIQHTGQVRKLYREDADIILAQPATRIFFRPRDLQTARLISDQLGYTTATTRDIAGKHIRNIERPRKLMDESEVARLPKTQIVVFTPDSNPIRLQAFAPDAFESMSKFQPKPRVKHPMSQQALNFSPSPKAPKASANQPNSEQAAKKRPQTRAEQNVPKPPDESSGASRFRKKNTNKSRFDTNERTR